MITGHTSPMIDPGLGLRHVCAGGMHAFYKITHSLRCWDVVPIHFFDIECPTGFGNPVGCSSPLSSSRHLELHLGS